jgi:hypothetical protein
MRKNIMFIIASILLIICLVETISFFSNPHLKTGAMAAMCFVGGFVFYLFGIIEDKDQQIARLRSKLFKANKALEQQGKEAWLEPNNLLQLSMMHDNNSFM